MPIWIGFSFSSSFLPLLARATTYSWRDRYITQCIQRTVAAQRTRITLQSVCDVNLKGDWSAVILQPSNSDADRHGAS